MQLKELSSMSREEFEAAWNNAERNFNEGVFIASGVAKVCRHDATLGMNMMWLELNPFSKEKFDEVSALLRHWFEKEITDGVGKIRNNYIPRLRLWF